MISKYILTQGLFFAVVVNVYLFLMMITLSPRIWGYSDYPEVVKNKVTPPTRREKLIGALVGLPWFIFVFGFPILSTYTLKAKLGGAFTFWIAFVHLVTMMMLTNLGDLVILDWLIVSTITPTFVIIPGSDAQDYKDFSHHYKGHGKATIIMFLLALILAGIIKYI